MDESKENLQKDIEQKREGFWKKLKSNKKKQVTFFGMLMAALCIVYFLLSSWLSEDVLFRKIQKYGIVADSTFFSRIEGVSKENGKIYFDGWTLKVNAEVLGAKVILKSMDGEEIHVLKTKLSGDMDAVEYAEYLSVEEKSKGTDFLASIKEKEIQEDKCYEVLLYATYYEEDAEITKKVSLNQYFYKNEVYNFNPMTEFEVPKFNNKEMASVIENGVLYGYSKENGAWVYSYKECLYWIFDVEYEWNKDEKLYVFLHLNTLDSEMLSETGKKYGFDNRDFTLSNHELLMEQDEGYRVAKIQLNTEYPITFLSTGHYDSEIGNRWSMRFWLVP